MTIPQHVLDLVDAHQRDLQKMALAADPDSVLVTTLTDKHFLVRAVPRAEMLTLLNNPPDALKTAPEPVEGALACLWVLVLEGDTAHWFSMSFFPEAQA